MVHVDSQSARMTALVLGDLEATRRTCAALEADGWRVSHLLQPSDAELREALSPEIHAVVVVVRGDVVALRYALLVEHLRPGVRLLATVFDRTLAYQLIRTVPNCTITSPADTAVPSIIGAVLADDTLAVTADDPPRQIVTTPDGLVRTPFRLPRSTALDTVRRGVGGLRPHDDPTRILLVGLFGLLGVLVLDWVLSSAVLHRGVAESFYQATRVVATVGPGDADVHGRRWYLVLSSILMLVTIGLTALFTAGVVDRLLSGRSVSIIGRRTVPRHDHVVIVGLGQVGLRLAIRLKRLGIPVVVLERDPETPNLRLAKAAHIPVLIAHGEDRRALDRLSLPRARALAAMASNDGDNVEVSIAALAVAPALRIVLRAGDDDVIRETQSLFRIGRVCDVSGMTAAALALGARGDPSATVYARGHAFGTFDGVEHVPIAVPERCRCAG